MEQYWLCRSSVPVCQYMIIYVNLLEKNLVFLVSNTGNSARGVGISLLLIMVSILTAQLL